MLDHQNSYQSEMLKKFKVADLRPKTKETMRVSDLIDKSVKKLNVLDADGVLLTLTLKVDSSFWRLIRFSEKLDSSKNIFLYQCCQKEFRSSKNAKLSPKSARHIPLSEWNEAALSKLNLMDVDTALLKHQKCFFTTK